MDDETSDPQTCSVAEAQARLEGLVRRVAHARERITITDQGQALAVLISPQELMDLEQRLATAEYQALFAGAVAETSKISEVLGRDAERREDG